MRWRGFVLALLLALPSYAESGYLLSTQSKSDLIKTLDELEVSLQGLKKSLSESEANSLLLMNDLESLRVTLSEVRATLQDSESRLSEASQKLTTASTALHDLEQSLTASRNWEAAKIALALVVGVAVGWIFF